jgi:hypothetical protein
MKMSLKKWMRKVIEDLEPIVKRHVERIRLNNSLRELKQQVLTEQFWT